MKNFYPIFLSSILAISATLNSAFADGPNFVQKLHSANVSALGSTLEIFTGKRLSAEAVKKTLAQMEALPAKAYSLMGEEFTDAKPILMQCINNKKEMTVYNFAYCCELALDKSFSYKCADLVKTAVTEHNKTVNIGDSCVPENDKLATSGKYIWVSGVKKCASVNCQSGSYLVRNSEGKSQGWCKSGVDPYMGPISAEFDMDYLSKVALLDVKPIETNEIDMSKLAINAVPTVSSEMEAKLAKIDAKAEAEKQKLAQQALAEQQKQANEAKCTEMGANSAEMLICRQDPVAWGTKRLEKNLAQQQKQDNEAKCTEMGAKGAEMLACKSDPGAWLTKRDAKEAEKKAKEANEQACLAQGLRKGTIEFGQCKDDPAAYQANSTICNSLNLPTVEFGQCMKEPKTYREKRLAKLQEQQAEEQKKIKCDSLGATAAPNRGLCMENPDSYSVAKAKCEGMNATGFAFNNCVKNPDAYKQQYDKEMAAKEKGMNVREFEKSQEREAEIQLLQKSLGLMPA